MPDLEKQITEWRRQMLAAGIKSPVPLEELENHLREEVARQMKSGLSEQKAFEISVKQMGQPELLKSEFKKVEKTAVKRIGIVAALIGAVIILRILTERPDAAHLRKNEQVTFLIVGGAILLFGLRNIIFNAKPNEPRDVRVWKLVGIAYSMGAVGLSMLPIVLFLTVPRFAAAVDVTGRILVFAAVAVSFLSVFGWRMSRRILPVVYSHRTRVRVGIASCLLGPVAVTLFWFSIGRIHFSIGVVLMTWALTAMAVLGGVGYGLTEAARGQTEPARS